MDENEAKIMASHWVRRLEATVLSNVHDNITPTEGHSIVTNRFRHDRSTTLTQPSPREKIYTDLTKVSPTSTFNHQEYGNPSKSTLKNSHVKPRNTSNETRTKSSTSSPRSARVNLEILRRKRLEHFGNKDGCALRIPGDKDHDILINSESVPGSSLPPSMLQCETTSDESSFSSSNNWNFTYDCSLNSQRSDDDDKLRLELWGLRGAVESGQLDIKSYIRPALSPDLTQNTKKQPLVDVSAKPFNEQSFSYQENLSKTSHNRDNNYNLTSFCNKSEDNSLEDSNLPLLASMLSIETPHWGGRHEDAALKEDFTRFSVSKHQPSSRFGCPAPQIEGKLYNGFETSDSESSVNTLHLCSNSVTKSKGVVDINKASKPSKSGRGKQKILTELTEFLDAERNSKKLNKNKENSIDTCEDKRSSSRMSFSDELLEQDLVLQSSSPTPVLKNGIRSRSTSPEDHRYLSTSAPAMYNVGQNFINQDGKSTEARHCNDESVADKLDKPDCSTTAFGKACPRCHEVNSKAANWCIECGTALISVEPTVLDPTQLAQYEQQYQETKKLINEALEYKSDEQSYSSLLSKKEKELKQDVINLSKEVEKNSGFSNESLQSNVTSYKRRWLKSSLAWSTFEPQELSKPPSINKGRGSEKKDVRQSKEKFIDGTLRSRSSTDLAVIETCKKKNKSKNGIKPGRRQRTTSATYHSADDYDTINLSINLEQTNRKSPRGSKSTNHSRPSSAKQSKEKKSKNRPGSARPHPKSPSPLLLEDMNGSLLSKKSPAGSVSIPQLNLDDLGSYDRILTLIRSQRDSEPVPYLYLPDEIILEIFSSLSNKDLVACACVCSQFYRIAMDETLWKTIVIRKNRNICDAWLESIGDRHPSSLTISQCSSHKVSSEGLRSLFRKCSESLEEVDFSGCSGGELIGESILLHISVRCFNVVSVDVSWTNVSDNGVQELAKNLKRLECLCLNGCQSITDKSLTVVSKRHGESLRIFEVFGCFNITPAGLLLFGSQCLHLQTLNIGQCHKMTDSAVGNLVSHLPEIENLDLRGCKQTRDSAVKKIVRHCPHLKSLVLANCPLITDATLTEISTNLAGIQSLDICGCSYITDAGVRALAKCCHKLQLLDLSSTGTAVTSKSIVALSNYCSQSLRVLKLSFCADISVNTVNQVVKNCKKLTLLHLYGCKRIKELDKIKNINPNLVIER